VTPVTESTFPAGGVAGARLTEVERIIDQAAGTEAKSADV
jgi:hypothetical protein